MNEFNVECDWPFHVAWLQPHSFFPARPCDTPLLPCQTIRAYQNNEIMFLLHKQCALNLCKQANYCELFLHNQLHYKNAHALNHKSSFMVRKSSKPIQNPSSITSWRCWSKSITAVFFSSCCLSLAYSVTASWRFCWTCKCKHLVYMLNYYNSHFFFFGLTHNCLLTVK